MMKNPDLEMLELVEEMSPSIGRLVLNEYQKMPFGVKDSLNELYAALEAVENEEGLMTVKEILSKLKEACEANPEYLDVYEAAKKECQEELAESIANNGMNLFDED